MHNIPTYHIRWAFIDLSAGPFAWGPAVGGEGVRTESSLPNVEKTIGAVSGTTGFLSIYFRAQLDNAFLSSLHKFFSYNKFWLFLWHVELSEDEAEDRLQDAIQEKFAIFGDVCDLWQI